MNNNLQWKVLIIAVLLCVNTIAAVINTMALTKIAKSTDDTTTILMLWTVALSNDSAGMAIKPKDGKIF